MLISIVIPCYNVETYVKECLISAIEQSYPDIEIICIDNNSTDNTLPILKTYADKFPHKIKVLQELKPGAPAARNKGILAAKGEWIQFLDADDLLLKDKLEHQVAFIKSHDGVEVLISPMIKNYTCLKNQKIEVCTDIWNGLIVGRAGSTCSNLFRKDTLLNVGNWDESKRSSQETWLLFSLLKKQANIQIFDQAETIINERIRGSITYTNRIDNWERYIQLRVDIWDFLKSTNKLNPVLENALKQSVFDSVRYAYNENIQKAVFLHDTYVKNRFTPVLSKSTNRKYLLGYRLFGFCMIEQIRSFINRVKCIFGLRDKEELTPYIINKDSNRFYNRFRKRC